MGEARVLLGHSPGREQRVTVGSRQPAPREGDVAGEEGGMQVGLGNLYLEEASAPLLHLHPFRSLDETGGQGSRVIKTLLTEWLSQNIKDKESRNYKVVRGITLTVRAQKNLPNPISWVREDVRREDAASKLAERMSTSSQSARQEREEGSGDGSERTIMTAPSTDCHSHQNNTYLQLKQGSGRLHAKTQMKCEGT